MPRILQTVTVLTLCMALAPMVPSAAAADLRQAIEAFKSGDFAQARVGFSALAELGDARSQYLLGTMYYNGEGGTRDATLGYGWIKLAAESGFAEAIAAEEKLRPFMSPQAVANARQRLDAYTPDAIDQRLMPRIIPDCDYVDRTRPKLRTSPLRISYPEEARRRGIEGAVTLELSVAADGTVRDARVVSSIPMGVFEEAAFRWLRVARFAPALRQGEPVPALHMLMVRFKLSGEDVELAIHSVAAQAMPDYRQTDEFVEQVRRSAEEGDPAAQYAYATVISGPPHYRKPWSDALPWIKRAASAGLKEAQFQLGQSLLLGRGCEADTGKAVEWLKLSAQQGSSAAGVTCNRKRARMRGSEDAASMTMRSASLRSSATPNRAEQSEYCPV